MTVAFQIRFVVTIGAALAFAAGCGGQSSTASSAGGSSMGGAAPMLSSTAGADSVAGSAGAAMQSGGAGATSSGVSCPPGQWDCSGYALSCSEWLPAVMPAGCVCDLTRPKTADDCGPDETIVCFKTIGGVSHAQCSCEPITQVYTTNPPGLVPTPSWAGDAADFNGCPSVCDQLFRSNEPIPTCSKPFTTTTCTKEGVCSVAPLSAADLRRQGLDCACVNFE